jgi:hypothetical protein
LDNDKDGLVDEDPPNPVDASSGYILVYDPDFEPLRDEQGKIRRIDISSLPCVVHDKTDGLHANLEGVYHEVLVRLPASFMQKAGEYRFVIQVWDNHAHLHKDHQVKPALERSLKEPKNEVLSVLPDNPTKVLISAKHGGGYPSPYQTQDGQIRIIAKVKGGRGKVFFEVVDPDDPSPYLEDTNHDTIWPQIEGLVMDDNPNDNRDPNKNGRLPYETFQNNCLRPRQVRIGDPNQSRRLPDGTWEVWTNLLITDRFTGDNYIVRATCEEVEAGKYFHEQPKLQGKYKESVLLTAWKRVYCEVDRMYKIGTDLARDTNIGDIKVFVRSARVLDNNRHIIELRPSQIFSVNDEVVVFDADHPKGERRIIVAIDDNEMSITLDKPLQNSYKASPDDAYYAIEGKGAAIAKPSGGFWEADIALIQTALEPCFVEVIFPQEGAVAVPYKHFTYEAKDPQRGYLGMNHFSQLWFAHHVSKGNFNNYIHLVGAYDHGDYRYFAASGRSVSEKDDNASYVFVAITGERTIFNQEITAHEIIHQWQFKGTDYDSTLGPNYDQHDFIEGGVRHSYCLMNYSSNFWDGIVRLWHDTFHPDNQRYTPDTTHIYYIRDAVDDLYQLYP